MRRGGRRSRGRVADRQPRHGAARGEHLAGDALAGLEPVAEPLVGAVVPGGGQRGAVLVEQVDARDARRRRRGRPRARACRARPAARARRSARARRARARGRARPGSTRRRSDSSRARPSAAWLAKVSASRISSGAHGCRDAAGEHRDVADVAAPRRRARAARCAPRGGSPGRRPARRRCGPRRGRACARSRDVRQALRGGRAGGRRGQHARRRRPAARRGPRRRTPPAARPVGAGREGRLGEAAQGSVRGVRSDARGGRQGSGVQRSAERGAARSVSAPGGPFLIE